MKVDILIVFMREYEKITHPRTHTHTHTHTDNVPASNHVITSNEGSAVAIGAGYHLATGKAPIVYLQVWVLYMQGCCYIHGYTYICMGVVIYV
jgi:hypothetical protein